MRMRTCAAITTARPNRSLNGRAAVMDCACSVGDKLVLTSEAHVLAPRRPSKG